MMLIRIKSFLNYLRWLLYNLLVKRILFSVSMRHDAKQNTVFFLMKENTSHRYFMNLCHFLIDQKYDVVIRPSFGFLGHWYTKEFIRQLPTVIYSFTCEGNPIIITDHKRLGATKVNHKLLRYDYFSFTPHPNNYMVPMCMVDTMYYYGYHRDSRLYGSNLNRNIRIFYVGNCTSSYRNPAISKTFALLDRVTLLDFIKRSFKEDLTTADISLIIKEKKICTVLILDRSENYILPTDLLKVLSHCSFILVPPGIVMPQTHFIVEGMSVGCIPILQYRQMFFPPLEHMKTCLYFNNEDDLEEIIKKAKKMAYREIAEMRINVLNYYSKHLDVSSVVHNVIDSEIVHIYLNAEAASVHLLCD